ncbi:S-layer homology domain-containing protein [Cohnella sp. OV330]|uniref:S-layer homology domain-containing protein n=1 Tax=Cohnella sp. OV330 TaxID=1855288 RepID=UPI0008E75ED9|nr:S-layer homology domain-containing protein [Cohnella sp. OV330]SFB51672.1 S-layer homology domain-containing protein [Cohnella sp. OV330]
MFKKWFAYAASALLAAALVIPGFAAAADDISFKDVGGTFWAKDEINSLVQLGVLKGYQDNTFKPQAPVTREEFAKIITSAFYLDLPASDAPQTFVDVGRSRWSFASVEAAKDFLTGYYPPSGKAFFDPTGKATREDVAVALVKTLGYQPDDLQDADILDRFYDSEDVSPNLETYVAIAVEKKLLTGYNDYTLKPGNSVTRAEAASLLYRVIKNSAADSGSALTLNVDAPETVASPTFYITGDVTKGADVTINNEKVEVVQGAFRVGIRLEQEGTYTYTISARLAGGKTESVTKKVTFEKGAPTLEVKGVPESSDKQSITVSWTVKDANDSSPDVYLNGRLQYGNSATVTLEEGDNVITVRAENAAGKTAEVTKHVAFTSGGPVLTVADLPETTDKETISVSWTAKDKNDTSPRVYVNDREQYYGSTTVTLKEGVNTIVVKATNSLGKSTTVTKTITFSVGTSTLTVGELPATTDKDSVNVTWSVKDTNDSSPRVYLNGKEQYYSNASVNLEPGPNTITVRAVNKLGKETTMTKTIAFEPPAPTVTLLHAPETTASSSISISWSATDKNDSSLKMYVNDKQTYYTDYTATLQPGENKFKITATNKYGKTTDVLYTVTYAPEA